MMQNPNPPKSATTSIFDRIWLYSRIRRMENVPGDILRFWLFFEKSDIFEKRQLPHLSWLISWIRSYENVPMDRRIISCFRQKSRFDRVFAVRVLFFEKTQISGLLARWKVPSWAMWQKAFICLKKALFSEKGVYFSEILLCRWFGVALLAV